jgi:uncharacterized protein YecE (DUF72 family)
MIRAGIGGWTYEPWRGTFFPPGLARSRELAYASAKLPAIEINGTFYRTPKPDDFRKWAAETPESFVFSVKAPRYATHLRKLAEAGPAIERFLGSGLKQLGPRLGPILWQFPKTKAFDEDDFAAFLALLPREAGGVPLRHALDVRHQSFADSDAFIGLAREAGAAIVLADSPDLPLIEAATADFVYARLMRSSEAEPAGYAPEELSAWARRAQSWAEKSRDVFVYFIDGAKIRAPSAALHFLALLDNAKEKS